MKLAVAQGVLRSNPLASVPRPKRSIPKHWTPDEARAFLRSQEGDRLYPLWAFLLGAGVRTGELGWLRWPNVDLPGRRVRIVEFATTLGWDLVPSSGKSATAVRTIDLDDGLVEILRRQQEAQRFEATRTRLRAERVRVHEADGRRLPPAGVVEAARRSGRGGGSAAADR